MYAYDQFRFVRPNFKVSIVYMIKEGIFFQDVVQDIFKNYIFPA